MRERTREWRRRARAARRCCVGAYVHYRLVPSSPLHALARTRTILMRRLSFVRHLLGTSLPQLSRTSVQQACPLHLSTFPVLRASSHSSCSTGRALAAGTSLSLPHSLSPHYFQVSEVPQGHPLTSAKLCWKVRALRLARHNKNARGQPLARALFNTRRDPSPARPASRPSAPRRLRPARRSCP